MSNTKPAGMPWRFLHLAKVLLMELYISSDGTHWIITTACFLFRNGEKSYKHGLPLGFVYSSTAFKAPIPIVSPSVFVERLRP